MAKGEAMRSSIVVREYAKLTTSSANASSLDTSSLDVACVPESAFDWLCQESARLQKSGAPLVQIESRRWLRLDNYVGVIETPCGTRIEVLPKTTDNRDDAPAARALLRKMLARCLNITPRQTSPTTIQTFNAPLNEWVMREFLQALDALVKRGLRFDYNSVQEEQRFLRGRLDVPRQLSQPPGRGHLFQIEHDVFDANRPENRLLCLALDRVRRLTRDADSWRLAHELAHFLAPVPRSSNVADDFRRWGHDRLIAHYRFARPWCALILNEQTPLSALGEWRGTSLLFPMEKVFERYVEACLRKTLPQDATLKVQASSKYLCQHNSQHWFQLRPDFIVKQGAQVWVLDTKWKRLDQALDGADKKYGLNQSDFYQLFAYGHRYLPAAGEMVLIYPRTARFHKPLPVFTYSPTLHLWVVPFDLQTGKMVDGPHPLSDTLRFIPSSA
jgi:5-methylcytosine-specific restriction enzyme subunit McrC